MRFDLVYFLRDVSRFLMLTFLVVYIHSVYHVLICHVLILHIRAHFFIVEIFSFMRFS